MNETRKRIVVGVDFDTPGDLAMREAIELARELRGSELHPVHVLPAPDQRGRAEHLDVLSHLLGQAADELRERALWVAQGVDQTGAWEQRVTTHVRFGDPAAVLRQVAIDVDADWIVVGTHARVGLSRLMLGSVAEALLKIAPVPVIIAREVQKDVAEKTERPEPARTGEDIHAQRSFSRSELLRFSGRESHVSGLI